MSLPVPVVVVGNISVGGTGKTPLTIALCQALLARGIKVGIISRGYGSKAASYPFAVTADSNIRDSGDEALLLARATACPVIIDPERRRALDYLLAQNVDIQLVISDDGLQHYRLPRSLELLVIDGQRGLGNGLCIPAGPLREPATRLASVDWIITNGEVLDASLLATFKELAIANSEMNLQPCGWRHLKSQQLYPLHPWPWSRAVDENVKTPLPVHAKALAAVGNPDRFFASLRELGIVSENCAFDDHYTFQEADLEQWRDELLLMTSKDAVKCQAFAGDNWWALEVDATLPEKLVEGLIALATNANQ